MNDLEAMFTFLEVLMKDWQSDKDLTNSIPMIDECLKTIEQYLFDNANSLTDVSLSAQAAGYWFYRIRADHFLKP